MARTGKLGYVTCDPTTVNQSASIGSVANVACVVSVPIKLLETV